MGHVRRLNKAIPKGSPIPPLFAGFAMSLRNTNLNQENYGS